MAKDETPRWHYRFDEFQKALALLEEAALLFEQLEVPSIVEEGFTTRFAYTWELAWKTLKDYLEAEGLMDVASPKATIRVAFEARLIDDGDAWMAALRDRNSLIHVYSREKFEQVARAVLDRHLGLLRKFRSDFLARRDKGQ